MCGIIRSPSAYELMVLLTGFCARVAAEAQVLQRAVALFQPHTRATNGSLVGRSL